MNKALVILFCLFTLASCSTSQEIDVATEPAVQTAIPEIPSWTEGDFSLVAAAYPDHLFGVGKAKMSTSSTSRSSATTKARADIVAEIVSTFGNEEDFEVTVSDGTTVSTVSRVETLLSPDVVMLDSYVLPDGTVYVLLACPEAEAKEAYDNAVGIANERAKAEAEERIRLEAMEEEQQFWSDLFFDTIGELF